MLCSVFSLLLIVFSSWLCLNLILLLFLACFTSISSPPSLENLLLRRFLCFWFIPIAELFRMLRLFDDDPLFSLISPDRVSLCLESFIKGDPFSSLKGYAEDWKTLFELFFFLIPEPMISGIFESNSILVVWL